MAMPCLRCCSLANRLFQALAGALACVLVQGVGVMAEEPPDRYGDIPADSIAVASVDIQAMRGDAKMEMIPWEILEVACREQFGFSLASVDSVDVTVGMPSPLPEVGVSIRFREAVDIADLNDSVAGEVQTAPKDNAMRFRDLIEAPMVRVVQREDRRVLVGTQGTLRRMVSQRVPMGGPMVQLVQSSSAPARMALNFAKIRDVSQSAYEQMAPTIPPAMGQDIEDMITLTEDILVELAPMASSNGFRISLGTSSGPNAETLLGSMNHLKSEGIQIARDNLDTQLDQDPTMSEAMRQAIASYSDRMQRWIDKEVFWSVEGERVQINMENTLVANYSTIGVLTGLLLPAVQSARDAARRMSSSNNLRQIQLSLLNYESAREEFPGRIVASEDGKPLLSWRVLMLPYLEEQQLFNEFNLDEPWDSEHNIQLLERMPAVYQNPRVVTLPGYTAYLAPYGEDAGWPEDPFLIGQITDGTSRTISVVEASAEVAVPWTKPDDLDIDQYADGSWMSPGPGANVVMFDGSVQFLNRFLDAEMLRAMFTMNGGELVRLP